MPVYLRILFALIGKPLRVATIVALAVAATYPSVAQQNQLPQAPSYLLASNSDSLVYSSSLVPPVPEPFSLYPEGYAETVTKDGKGKLTGPTLDAEGNPIPLERRQPTRILGIMPNYRTVSAGAKVHPPSWKYNFNVASHQALDYSSFVFLGLTSLTAEATNSHTALGKGPEGFFNYTWRGFLDKSDNTFLSAWFLASLLHEDTRYYPLGSGHSIATRALYVISRQGVARTYGGRQTPNIAGLGGKVLTQVISRYYYPTSATDFGTLATKFAYSAMRDVAFSSIREFYPDIAAHYIRKHREKVAALAARDATQSAASLHESKPQ